MDAAPKCPELEAHLLDGEQLVWCERSLDTEVRRRFGRTAIFLSIAAAVVAAGVFVIGISNGFRSDIAIMGIFFAVLAWTSIRAARRPYHYWYGLTQRRVLVLGANGGLASYAGHDFAKTKVEMLESSGGKRGNLSFDYGPDGEGHPGFRADFLGIPDPTCVERLIRETLL